MFALMISRSSLKLGHLGSKTRSPGQIKGPSCLHSRGHIFEVLITNIAKMFVLISRSSSKLGQLGSKPRLLSRIKGNLFNTLEVTFLKQSYESCLWLGFLSQV